MPIKPGRFKLAVIPIKDPLTTKGGLYKDPSSIQRTDRGIVRYIGPGVEDIEDISPLDFVLFSPYNGKVIAVEGAGEFLIIDIEDISAVISPEKEEKAFPLSVIGDFARRLSEDGISVRVDRLLSSLEGEDGFRF